MQLATQISFLAKIPVTLMRLMHVELRGWWMKLVMTTEIVICFLPLCQVPVDKTLTQPVHTR